MKHPGLRQRSDRAGGTRTRLLAAATDVFARRGYRGATMREIAQQARANLASAHYHFGSKQDLYLEVVRGEFAVLESRLSPGPVGLLFDGMPRLARKTLEALLATRVETLLAMLLDPNMQHGKIILRELCDPSDALPLIVRRFVAPLVSEMARSIATLAPSLSADDADRCTRSVVGQIFFYFSHRPALLLMMGRGSYPKDFVRTTAAHITRFSLGGIAAVAASEQRPARRGRVSGGARQ